MFLWEQALVAVSIALQSQQRSLNIKLQRSKPAWPAGKLQTFSAIFPGFEKNEEKYIDEVANHFHCNLLRL
jgi:hypothetical protein